MRALMVGAGAVGGYFGGRLLQAGRNVTFLVRPERAAVLAKSGLVIRSPHGNLHLPSPPTLTPRELRDPFDLIIVSCKAQDLAPVMESFAPAVGAHSAILPLLNGMRHLDMLVDRFGGSQVLGGQCLISVTRDSQGQILQLTDPHELSFGERDGSRNERGRQFEAILTNAGFDARLSENIMQEMWSKWAFIAAGAGITCLMRAAVGDIVAAGATELTLALIAECAEVAALEGFPTSATGLERIRQMFTQPGSPLTSSMLRDIENHSATEGDHILGDLLRRAKQHDLDTPILRIAAAHVRAYDKRRERERRDVAVGS